MMTFEHINTLLEDSHNSDYSYLPHWIIKKLVCSVLNTPTSLYFDEWAKQFLLTSRGLSPASQ